MPETFFITTAIDYTNGAPHIGHAYEKVLADVLARYHRLKGDNVFFLTGVDQHGQKVQQSAEREGVAPQMFVDGITAKFRALWEKLNVRYDGWAATTDVKHKDCVRAILQRLWDDKVPGTDRSRWIYLKAQRGYYSVRQEQFITDKERGPDGEFGAEWGQVEEREEENFYFRLTPHEDLGFDPKQWLLKLIASRTVTGNPLVVPEFRVSELRNAVEKLDADLCISRPSSRLQWGIPFPEEWAPGFVTYVWFDALVNYISFAPGFTEYFIAEAQQRGGEQPLLPLDLSASASSRFKDWWPALHVIGKDILIPAHGVYWPIMLKALGFDGDDIPQLLVHGWWNISGAKISKSVGNTIDPDALADRYGAEAVRYYLVSDIATGKDADFSEERLIQRYNSDLANSLGNLLNRALSMAAKYRGGFLKQPTNQLEHLVQIPGAPFFAAKDTFTRYTECIDAGDPSGSLKEAFGFSKMCNMFVDFAAPWTLAKSGTSDNTKLDDVLYSLAESLRIIAILLSPVLPEAAHRIFDQLNWKMDEQGQETRFRLADAVWGGLPDGHQLGSPTPLFPRIEVEKPV